MRALVLASALALSVGAACAPQPMSGMGPTASMGGDARRCFRAQEVNGFRQASDRTVDLTVGANRVYRVDLFGVCPDLRAAVGVAVRTRGGSSYVCEGPDVELIVPSEIGPNQCLGRSIRQRTDAELQAERAARR